MEIYAGEFALQFREGGVFALKGGQTLYFNRRPMYAFIKTALSITEFYDKAYDEVVVADGQVTATGTLVTPTGTELYFSDVYRPDQDGFQIDRTVQLLKTVDDLGFATKIAFVLAESDKVRDYDCFAPGNWYRQNEYAAEHVMGYDPDCEYFLRQELNYGLPLFAVQSKATGETIMLSRWAADVAMRDHDQLQSEHSVDRMCNTGSIGISRPESKSLNYLYYGFPLRKEIGTVRDGLSIDYVYPGCDGELPRQDGYNIDYMMRTKTMTRVYHPAEVGFTQRYAVAVHFARYDGFYPMMRETWRSVYRRLRAPLYQVDHERHYRNCMELLAKLTRRYGNSYGLPFSCQLPHMDVSSVSFQFGFVGQQPGIGFHLIRYGDRENRPEAYDKGIHIVDFWVRAAATESGAPNVCYNPAIDGFEPYPHWTRMIADGLEAILDAYVYLSQNGEKHPNWLAFCRRSADWLVDIQNADGSFYRAYNSDGTMRMSSKANTTSVIRFLIQLSLVCRDERYEQAAMRAGAWAYDNVYRNMEYRGSTCDNLDILDNESGIYAMYGFLALYDLTGDDKWLTALKAAADFTETWTYAWSFPVRTPWSRHPFNHNSISGQSIITIGGGADVYMAACSFTYYRLYLITGDTHYLDFAEFIHNNTRQSNDVDGSAGYAMPGLGHESGNFATQTLISHYHWLPWCTYVEVDPTARLYDAFGSYDIAGAQHLSAEERQARNSTLTVYAGVE